MKYGTLVATGLITTGVLVWVTPRQEIEAIDMIEILEGCGKERPLATQSVEGPATVRTQTVAILQWANNDPTGLGWYTETGSGANYTIATNIYRTVSGTNQVTVTYTNAYGGSTYSATPYRFAKTYRTQTTNRYIWGPWTNIVGSGFIDGILAAGYNTTYWFKGRTINGSEIVDLYESTNALPHQIRDFGPRESLSAVLDARSGFPQDLRLQYSISIHSQGSTGTILYVALKGNSIPWGTFTNYTSDPVFDGSATGASFTVGALITNLMRDAYVMDEQIIYDTIDWTVTRKWYQGKSVGGEDDDYDEGISGKIRECIPFYLDDTLATNGLFVGYSNAFPVLNETGLWDRLNIGYITNSTTALFSDEELSSGSKILVDFTLNSTNMGERYKVAEALRWNTPGTYAWSTNGGEGEGNYQWDGNSTVDWATAKGNAESGGITTGDVRVAYPGPMMGTWGWYNPDSGTWFAGAEVQRVKVQISGVWTGTPTAIDFYSIAEPYVEPTGQTNLTWDDNGEAVSNGEWRVFDTGVDPTNYNVVTSIWLGVKTVPVWVDEPSGINIQSRGFRSTGMTAVAKWTFTYCTNSI